MTSLSALLLRAILLPVMLSGLAFRFASEWLGHTVEYQIQPDSEVMILGTTNINKFQCDCLAVKELPPGILQAREVPDAQKIVFREAILKIPSKAFHCGNKGINRDMAKTLKAEQFPHILITLKETHLNALAQTVQYQEWQDYLAITELSIAGIKKNTSIQIKGKRLSNGVFHFQGQQPLLLSDFDLTAPKPLLGLIKIDDMILIHFDLKVQVL